MGLFHTISKTINRIRLKKCLNEQHNTTHVIRHSKTTVKQSISTIHTFILLLLPIMSRKIILELADLEEHEWRLDDVFNQLAYLMVRIDDKSFNFDPMQLLTKAFSPGGVAANVKLPLESFKMIVQRLKAIRNEVDIRIMQNFWPLFHQIYLHVDDWNGAISHFINVHELWDRGQSLIPSKSMEKSYPKYESEFGTARQFIVYDPLDGVFSEQFHEHCRQLAFFMMLQPKRASKELTVAVLKSAHSLRNPRPINKLALFFHHAQAFAHYVVPEVKKQLPVALIYRMQEDTEALKDMNSVAKGDLLLQLCDRLTNDLVYNEYEKKATTTNTGPLDNAVLLQQRQWLLQLLAMGGCQPAAAAPPLAPHSHQQQQHVQHQQHVTSNHHHMFDEAAATSLSAALAAAATMLKKEVEEESPPVAAAAADVFVFNKSQQQRAVKEAIGAMLAAKRRPKREPQQQDGKHGDQAVQNVQQQRGQYQQQDRPQLGFSIDGLLKDVAESGRTAKSSPPSAGQQAMIDYFMEEHELSWTDGRRGSRRGSSNNNNSTKTKTAAAAAKPALLEKQPPLPSASSTASSRPSKHVCLVCGKSYATSSNLSRHKQTHRPLDSPDAKKCSFCDRVYVSMPALSMHLLTHQARHKCALCGKLFSRPWLLKGHLRSHTGQKPFGCGNCGKAFSDRSNLRAHLNTHNSDKRWRCHRCGRAFALKSYLAKHLEQQHGADGGGRLGMSSNSSAESTSGGGGGEEEEEEAGGTDLDAAMMVALPSLCDDDDDDEQMELERMELEQQQDEEEGGNGIEGHNGD